MAKTAKSDAIGLEKDRLIREIDLIRLKVKEIANNVPDHVLRGDAIIAAKWLERAEVGYFRPYEKIANKRKTLEELKAMLEEEHELIRSIENPQRPEIAEVKQTPQLDMFAA